MIKELALTIGDNTITPPGGAPSGGADMLQKIIQVGLTLALIGAVVLALFVIIMGGIQWTASGGDKQKIQQARLRITFAVLGLIVAFLAFFAINVVYNFLGIKL